MDQEKIGVFISTLRKEQGMTQQQLADAIGVSNKTISKWECGKGMPELALIVPLCHILQISINEFLSGEHLLENGYTEKAEVNMMNLLQETENSKKKSRSSLLAFGITVTIFFIRCFIFCYYQYGNQYEYAFCGYAYIIEYVFSYCSIFAGDKFGTTLF